MPLILGTNSIKDTGFNVDNSLRFNSGSSDYLSFTPSSTSNQKTWTVSCWVKRSALTSTMYIWGVNGDTSGHYFSELNFNSGDQLEFIQGGTVGDPYQTQMLTNARFRDTSAWLNIVVAVDTTQSTESNRFKMYVNGEQITDWAISNYPSQNENFRWHFVGSEGYPHSIGRTGKRNSNYFDGYICEWIDIDGTQLDATSFGEFDSDSPTIWKPKDISGLTLGTNGAYLDFEDSSSLGNSVGNSNNYTANNLTSIDQSIDTCTNNFATMNPLNAYYDVCTTSEGNTKYDGNSATGNYTFTPANMGFSKGKWYWEMKFGSSDSDNWGGIGITSANSTGTQNYLGGSANAYAYYGRTLSGGLGVTYTNNTQTNQGLPFGNNDIIMVAVDCDNLAIYFGKNGTWLNNSSSVTGVPTSGSSKTGAFFSITAPSSTTAGFYFPASGTYSGAQVYPQFLNFGSPAFSISSGNSDGNGFGNFEYSVPSGYFALCTKNLAEHG